MCMILMIAIIQGLYIYREDEDEEIERHRREAAKRARQRAVEAAEEKRLLKKRKARNKRIYLCFHLLWDYFYQYDRVSDLFRWL